LANENLPAHVAASMTEIGSITYANEVVAIIAGMAAAEIDGVAAMGSSASIVDLLGRKNKPVTRGVKVEVGSEEASVDLVFTVEYGKPIQKVCRDVQESVRKSIETMTGLHVVKVDVHVLGVSFEKETQLTADLAQAATAAVTDGSTGPTGPLGQIVRSRPITRREPEPEPPLSSHPDGADEDVDLPETSIDMSGDDLDGDPEPAVPDEPFGQEPRRDNEAAPEADKPAPAAGTPEPSETPNASGDAVEEAILADGTL
jgi:uncharacterized alkaline shock family protein YloU